MQPLKKDVNAWLKYANNDLSVARREMNATRNPRLRPYEIILHHCHQCAEKSLKAFLLQQIGSYPFTHKRDELLRACEAIDTYFTNDRIINHCLWLNTFWNVKYPDFTLTIDAAIATRGINSAKRVHEAVITRLKIGKM
ncbi:MAG: HEPN domain-containing protein [Defluviitaleaceae bacterium]|nr:HEPN domain-containing protein [Defluviitaleaceae bacterium]MCL2274639.1 HEPN domain-containing protein [Defluviitaleaceae bacterium]